MGKRLYVGNLPYDANEASLREMFAQDGRKVERVHIVLDRETNRPRGFAFVEMGTDEEAKQAITSLDGKLFGGRSLRVNEAEDRRPGGPGGPGGPRGPGGPPRGPGGPRQAPAGADSAIGGGGGARPKPWEAGSTFSEPPRPKKEHEKKTTRRKHDTPEDYGGRRGSSRFDDDDDAG